MLRPPFDTSLRSVLPSMLRPPFDSSLRSVLRDEGGKKNPPGLRGDFEVQFKPQLRAGNYLTDIEVDAVEIS